MLAEYVLLHENAPIHLPAYMSYIKAASLPCAAVSAWSSLNLATPLQPGQMVLIQGTGGVALFSLQIVRVFGTRVLAITSSDKKGREAQGVERRVSYSAFPDWDREILALTDGRGVNKSEALSEGSSRDTLSRVLHALAPLIPRPGHKLGRTPTPGLPTYRITLNDSTKRPLNFFSATCSIKSNAWGNYSK